MKVPEKDQIQYIHYHTGRMQDASSGAFYKTDWGEGCCLSSNTNMKERYGVNLNARNAACGLMWN